MSSYSKSSAASQPSSSRYSQQSPWSQPSALFMGTAGVPPFSPTLSDVSFGSPSPGSNHPPSGSGAFSILSAPHLRPIDLPPPSAGPSRYSYGLATPPGSPQAPTNKFSLHPLLRTNGTGRALITYNAMHPPSLSGPCPVLFAHGQGYTSQDVNQPATNPPVSHIRLTCQAFASASAVPFPWTLELESGSRALTVYDVLAKIHASLARPVTEGEYTRFHPSHQEMARFACTRRQRVPSGFPARGPEGFTRSDFLGDSTFFMGIYQAADGSLVLRLSSSPGP